MIKLYVKRGGMWRKVLHVEDWYQVGYTLAIATGGIVVGVLLCW